MLISDVSSIFNRAFKFVIKKKDTVKDYFDGKLILTFLYETFISKVRNLPLISKQRNAFSFTFLFKSRVNLLFRNKYFILKGSNLSKQFAVKVIFNSGWYKKICIPESFIMYFSQQFFYYKSNLF